MYLFNLYFDKFNNNDKYDENIAYLIKKLFMFIFYTFKVIIIGKT